MPLEELFGSIRFVYYKEHLAQKSDLKIKGEDNSMLLNQAKLLLGNIFEGMGNFVNFQVNAENS